MSGAESPRGGRRLIVEEQGVTVRTSHCTLGVQRGVFEGVHRNARIALVLAGKFRYETSGGSILLTRGAILTGRPGGAYRKAHVDGGGDRCLVFDYEEEFFEENEFADGFRSGAFLDGPSHAPISLKSLKVVAAAEDALERSDHEALRVCAHAVIEVALAAAAPRGAARRKMTVAQERRLLQVVTYVEEHFTADCSLEKLSEVAGLSRFHTLRLFRTLTGQTPLQFVLAARLRAAAHRLSSSSQPVTEIAWDVGFSDISNFNLNFRRTFGLAPSRYRSAYS